MHWPDFKPRDVIALAFVFILVSLLSKVNGHLASKSLKIRLAVGFACLCLAPVVWLVPQRWLWTVDGDAVSIGRDALSLTVSTFFVGLLLVGVAQLFGALRTALRQRRRHGRTSPGSLLDVDRLT